MKQCPGGGKRRRVAAVNNSAANISVMITPRTEWCGAPARAIAGIKGLPH